MNIPIKLDFPLKITVSYSRPWDNHAAICEEIHQNSSLHYLFLKALSISCDEFFIFLFIFLIKQFDNYNDRKSLVGAASCLLSLSLTPMFVVKS